MSPSLPFSASSVTTSPFDPDLPEDGALIIAAVLRDQFNALNDDIQTRATEAALETAVGNLDADIQTRVTEDVFNTTVDSLNADIQSRVTGPQLNAAVDNAINTSIASTLPQTSANSNAVSTFDQAANSYYDQYQIQQFIDKVNELINTLRR